MQVKSTAECPMGAFCNTVFIIYIVYKEGQYHLDLVTRKPIFGIVQAGMCLCY